MVLLPAKDIQNWLNYSRDLAKYLARPDEFAPDVSLMSITVSEEDLHSLATNVLGLQYTEEKFRTGNKWPSTPRTPPFTYRLNLELRNCLLFEREYGQEVEIEGHPSAGKMLLRLNSPVKFSDGGYAYLRLRSVLFEGFPRRAVIAEKIVNNGFWKGDSIQFATSAMNYYRLEVNLPKLEEATHSLIASSTTKYELSEKGRLADALCADTDLTALLRPAVYEAICHLTTPRSSAFRREMEALRARGTPEKEVLEFGARWGGRGERRYDSVSGFIARHGKSAPDAVRAFETLCELDWAERGVQTSCTRCGLRSFVPIVTLQQGGAQCPGCHNAASYTIDETGLAIQYRLNTLIDLASDQGVLPHLLVIAALSRQCEQTRLLGGTLVTLQDGSKPEVDILGIYDRKFVSGEVKAKARDFTQEQIKRDVEVCASLGVDMHIIAAIDSIPATVIQSAMTLVGKANLTLLVLSKDELRPDPPSFVNEKS
jgi:hypothetical protein